MPHESILGPLLFLVFINDLMENVESREKLFADDAKLYRKIRTSYGENYKRTSTGYRSGVLVDFYSLLTDARSCT